MMFLLPMLYALRCNQIFFYHLGLTCEAMRERSRYAAITRRVHNLRVIQGGQSCGS